MITKKMSEFLISVETARILAFISLSLTYSNASSLTDCRVSKFARIPCKKSARTVHLVGHSARISGAHREASAFNFVKISSLQGESFKKFCNFSGSVQRIVHQFDVLVCLNKCFQSSIHKVQFFRILTCACEILISVVTFGSW